MTVTDKCFQCGKKLIVVSKKKKYINKSWVVITKTKCSDPECQKRIDKMERERKRMQKEIALKKAAREKEALQKRKYIYS